MHRVLILVAVAALSQAFQVQRVDPQPPFRGKFPGKFFPKPLPQRPLPKPLPKPFFIPKPFPKPKPAFDCKNRDDGDYPNPKGCSPIFFACSNGKAIEKTCGEGQYFHPKTGECDIFAFACTGKTRPPTTPEPERTQPKRKPHPEFDCRNKKNGVFSPKCDTKYFVCNNGFTEVIHCDEGLYYDKRAKMCLSFNEVFQCSGKQPKPTFPPTPRPKLPPVPVDCKTLGDGNHKNPREKCSQIWYQCSNGIGVEMRCKGETYFNPKIGTCDDFNFACGNELRLPPKPTQPPKPLPKFPFNCEGRADGNFPAGKCVNFYWTCSGGVTSKMFCAENMFYDADPDYLTCGRKKEIPKCGGVRPTIPPQVPTKPVPKVPFDCSKREDGKFAAGKCEKFFYTCSGGVASKMDCAAVLYYDEEFKTCEKKNHIPKCGGTRPTKAPPVNLLPKPFPKPFPKRPFVKPFPVRKPFPQPFQRLPAPQPKFRPLPKFRPRINPFQQNLDQSAFQRRGGFPNTGSGFGGVQKVTG